MLWLFIRKRPSASAPIWKKAAGQCGEEMEGGAIPPAADKPGGAGHARQGDAPGRYRPDLAQTRPQYRAA